MSITSTDSETLFPWGNLEEDLNLNSLTAKDKMWFAREVNEKRTTAAKLSRKFNIKYRTVVQWANRVRNGKSLQIGAGRPKVLDRRSQRAMTKFVRSDPHVSYFDLGVKLDQEYIKSLNRRPDFLNNVDHNVDEASTMLTTVSFGRYLTYYKRMAEDWDAVEDDLSVGPLSP